MKLISKQNAPDLVKLCSLRTNVISCEQFT